jgi:hypothetical protein
MNVGTYEGGSNRRRKKIADQDPHKYHSSSDIIRANNSKSIGLQRR